MYRFFHKQKHPWLNRSTQFFMNYVLWNLERRKSVGTVAYGRVNDPMAKLQFLRVGWGGVGWGWWHSFNLNNMVDATQLCLSCHCTHCWCYATSCFLHLHTWSVLRNLCLSCHCTHGGCYATSCFLALAHMVDATQHHVSYTCTHGRC